MQLHIQEWFRAFPDLDVTLRKIIAEGDKVFVETRFAGTHLGIYGGIEATGKRIGVSVLAIFKIASGQLAGHAVMVDALGLCRQIGKIDLEQPGSLPIRTL
jgi:predicted ester cyclase